MFVVISRLCVFLLSLGAPAAGSNYLHIKNEHPIEKPAADTTDAEKIAQVRVTVHSIDRSLASYQKVSKENVPGESLEGNQIDQYLLDDQVKKITAVFYGETGQKSEEYYFDDHQLVFYYSKEERYSMSLGSGDVKIASVIEKRYYFFDGQIFLVKLKPESNSPVDMKKLSEETLKEARRLMKLK